VSSCNVSARLAQTVLSLLGILGALVPGMSAQADVQGQWSTLPYMMPINPVHVALLRNGKILVVSGSGNCPPGQPGCPTGAPYGPSNNSGALVLDPGTGTITGLTAAWDMFCSSMTQLADGRILINGGTLTYQFFLGSPKSAIFDPGSNAFTDQPNMAHGRWYPTVILLSDGRVMTFSGFDDVTGATNTTVEIFTVGSGFSSPIAAGWTPPLYPRLHLLPDGDVFYSGPSQASYLFNVSNMSWTQMDNSSFDRTYGSSVMLPLTPANNYDPKVMLLGGNSPATATTELIDLGASSPTWAFGPEMSQPRVEMDAVMLPTGKILAIGGSAVDEDATTASLNADLYDPVNNSFSSAGANLYARMYHTVALLLPDATVWLAGSNPERGTYEHHMEIYQPAYLFTRDANHNLIPATRPTIASAPINISWGRQFVISTPDAASISQVVLVRPGSSTHAFDLDQRLVGMSFTTSSSTLTVTAPPNASIAPLGYYMLFVANSAGVPSVASFVGLNNSSAAPLPTVATISPNSGSVSGGTSVTVTGTGFSAGATLSLGGTLATNVVVVNSASIRASTAPHASGTVDAVVTNSDSQSGILSNGFTYTSISPPPTLLGLGLAPGDSGSVTVTAGQTASYSLSIGGAGVSGTASLACTGAPSGADCSVPANESFTSNTPGTFVVKVTTASRTVGALHLPASPPMPWMWTSAIALLAIAVPIRARAPQRSRRRYLRFAPLTVLFLVSCGGGGGTGDSLPNPTGTPSGTYTLTVKATSNSRTEATSLTLTVQ
jgi:hypothetical protein